jgi:hypothetical protein
VALTAQQVDAYVRECLAESKPATVNRRTQLLRQAYNLAIQRGISLERPSSVTFQKKGTLDKGSSLKNSFGRYSHTFRNTFVIIACSAF